MPKMKETNEVRRKYEFIRANQGKRSVRMMCRLLNVAPSGYYAWLKNPMSNRAKDNARLLRLIRASFKASQGVFTALGAMGSIPGGLFRPVGSIRLPTAIPAQLPADGRG